MNTSIKIGLILITCSTLTACGSLDRVSNIGKAPDMSNISNPMMQKGYQPVSLPMPTPKNVTPQRNSLWAEDRKTFFKDQRAGDVGDIITVLIAIDDKATLDNQTERTRGSSEKAGLDKLLGFEQDLSVILPETIDNTALIDGSADSNFKGTGAVDRKEKVEVQLAALVTQILPNGNLVVHGRQEVRVNFENRILNIEGVIRPEDISIQNTISYEKIAEARISYGGEGQITDVQQPRYGQQLYDVVFPF